jgi:hypothetical protein
MGSKGLSCAKIAFPDFLFYLLFDGIKQSWEK